jgi:hypothetical protein
MLWTERDSNAAVVRSPTQTISDGPYRVLDLGDGTAMLQLDVEASWSAILLILKIITPDGPDAHA